MDTEITGPLNDGHGEPGGSRWRRWLHAMSPPRTPLVKSVEPPHPILVPCQGQVFDFRLFPCFTWRAADLGEERMRHRMAHLLPQANLRLRRHAADLASRYAPQEGQLFADELNRRLGAAEWRFSGYELEPTCQVWCRVELDEAVRTTLQPLWQERIELEERYELDLRRAAVAHDLTEAYSGIIEKLHDDPFSEPAARLGDAKFAETFVGWREEQRMEIESLLKLLEQAGRGFKRMGIYEFARSFDATLLALRKRHGLPVDDGDPDAAPP